MAKKIVIPGEVVSEERKKLGSHVFVENGKIYSDVLGIIDPDSDLASVIPLQGKYMPLRGDLIVGIVVDEKFAGYIVDINSFYYSFVPKEAVREKLKRGSIISAKISDINEINEADLEDIRVFYGGEIITVQPVKVPRMIGKNASMLDVLRRGTGANLLVGRNGRIWLKGGDTQLLEKAVRKIESEAHLSSLTNKIEEFLKNEIAERKNRVN